MFFFGKRNSKKWYVNLCCWFYAIRKVFFAILSLKQYYAVLVVSFIDIAAKEDHIIVSNFDLLALDSFLENVQVYH